jgi:hemolysin III
MLIARNAHHTALISVIIYSISLCGLFGISALYHRPQWQPKQRLWMRRLDHSFIFFLIAGTATPLSQLTLAPEKSLKLNLILWMTASLGVIKTLFWSQAPKLLSAVLYIGTGWIMAYFLPDFTQNLNFSEFLLLLMGGIIYSIGALIYAVKWPNPSAKYFGYHEIFHILVIIAAVLHFLVINNLLQTT